jgi:ABC-2 type transport system ATP-binding protein
MPAPSSTPTEALRAAGVSRSPGGVPALDSVSFAVATGELAAVVGANGSGKSTLLRLLAGLGAPDAGRVEVLGMDPVRDAGALRPRVGYAEQHPALDPEMTGAETLRLFRALRGVPADRPAPEGFSTEDLGLAPILHRRVSGWSGGERQRLHLALALLHAPSVLLLDEPTAALDPEGRRRFWERLAGHCAAGGAALVATHDLAEAERRCGRVLLLHGGRLLVDGRPDALVRAHGRARVTVVVRGGGAERAAAALRELPDAEAVEVEGGAVTLWRREAAPGADPALTLLEARGTEVARYERAGADLASACRRLAGVPVDAGGERAGRRGGRR